MALQMNLYCLGAIDLFHFPPVDAVEFQVKVVLVDCVPNLIEDFEVGGAFVLGLGGGKAVCENAWSAGQRAVNRTWWHHA